MRYNLIEKRELEDVQGTGLIYEHKETKARVCFIVNDDENRTFSVSFRTPSTDSTGVPHILEHSVLCGSRKYPVKDPFIELARGSLNTFLNAMTFLDKTMYPLASTNLQDFHNLMDVYLDAVFHPNIYDNEKIFAQEGWHYELESEEAEISYKGIVYNEMKGAFSAADQVLYRNILHELYSGHVYSNESGGDPEAITDLTYDQFLEFHKSYYHPSNSYIFYYGKLDVEEELNLLDENYLSDFEYQEIDSKIPLMDRFDKPASVEVAYPIGEEESDENKTYLSYNLLLKEGKDIVDSAAFKILEYLLVNAPGAPIKEALVKAGIGEDVYCSFEDNIRETAFSIIAKNCDGAREAEFKSIIEEQLQKIVTEGIDEKKLKAAINRFEFKAKESDFGHYPKGIIFAINVLDTWLYDEDPFASLEYGQIYESLKEKVSDGYIESLIQEYFLSNKHKLFMKMVPSKTINKEKAERTKERLMAYEKTLSAEDKVQLVKKTKELQAYQEEKDSEEALKTIPLLALEDIDRDKKALNMKEKMIKDTKVLYHHGNASDIAYIKCDFDISFIEEEQLPMLSLLSRLLIKMNTTKHGYGELSDEINLVSGGIATSVNVYEHKQSTKYFVPTLEISGKCFMDQVDKMYELMEEIMTETVFDDVSRIKELINEIKSRLHMSIYSSGHATAILRASSYMSKVAAYRERLKGLYFYQVVSEWQQKSDDDIRELGSYLKVLLQSIVNTESMTVAITTSKEYEAKILEKTETFVSKLPYVDRDNVRAEISCIEANNEGIKTTSDVQYVALVANYKKHGFEYEGSLNVLNLMVSGEYLWNNIRIVGGAYGAFSRISRNGQMYLCSYRDPNLKESLTVYEKTHEYIQSLNLSDREVVKYIIGSIGQLDQPLTASLENEKIMAQYFSEITHEDILMNRHQILDTTEEKIKSHVELFQKILIDSHVVVVGSGEKIEEAKDLFGSTLTIV